MLTHFSDFHIIPGDSAELGHLAGTLVTRIHAYIKSNCFEEQSSSCLSQQKIAIDFPLLSAASEGLSSFKTVRILGASEEVVTSLRNSLKLDLLIKSRDIWTDGLVKEIPPVVNWVSLTRNRSLTNEYRLKKTGISGRLKSAAGPELLSGIKNDVFVRLRSGSNGNAFSLMLRLYVPPSSFFDENNRPVPGYNSYGLCLNRPDGIKTFIPRF